MTTLNLNMLHSLKPFQCPNCNSSYSAKDIARSYSVAKFPRILTCGHSVCENCLQVAEKHQRSFLCSVCKQPAELTDGNSSENFLPDVHALGIISANMKNSLPSLKLKMVSSDPKRNQCQDSMRSPGSGIICGKCIQEQALWRCDECQLNFCSLCFKENHKDKSRKRHEGKKIFAELYNSLVQEGCPVHENRAIEFFCEVDNQLTCSYCMLMGEHVGHQVKTLVDKNKSCVEDLKTSLVDITNMQKQLKYTDHLLCEKIPKERLDISDTIKYVHEHFHTLHATLQLREAELISELTTISQRNVKPLEDMRLKVTNYERELASVKKDVESIIENPCLAISAPAILKKIEESRDFPCYLVPLPGEIDKKFNLNVHLNENLEKQIKGFGEIHFDGKARFVLLPGDDLPEDFCKEVPESFNIKAQASLDTESCSETFSTFSEDSLSVNTTNSSHFNLQASLKCRDFNRMQPEKVIVSFIKDPSHFYIQRFNELRKLVTMSDLIDKWCKSYESKKSKVCTVETGDLYLVRYSVDNKWYRGRVVSIKTHDSNCIGIKSPVKDEDGKIMVKDKEANVQVFYIDYGNTELTSLSNMKNIQARFLKLPGMAKHCCLSDIQPCNGDTWSTEAIKAFGMFVNNKPVVMQVFEERNNILNVDLSQVADDISNDVPVSVRDALVFLEMAVFESNANTGKKTNKNEPNCMPPESLCVNANICAIVSHVDNPSHFYVQQISTASYLAGLIHDMTETYNKEKNSMLHGIYAPRIGMVCAAQYSVDKQWYRARVIDLPGGAEVKVQYVDFGNTEVVHHKYLRKLFDKFFKLNIQAIPCKLAQVTYNQAIGWSNEAKKWLTEKCSRKQLTLKSLGSIPGENKAEVVLYFAKDDTEICINALMVEDGFAESTGEYSRAVRKKIEGKSPKKDLHLTDSVLSLRDIATAVISPPVPRTVQTIDFTCEEEFLEVPIQESQSNASPENTKSSPQRKYPSLAPPPVAEGDNYLEVRVSHIETPGSFYIQVAGDKDKLNALIDDLQKVYEKAEGEIEYTVGKAYAVYSKVQKKWLRGSVLSKISEDKVQIYYVDFGNTEEVDKKNLQKLLEKFLTDESFSVRCHLDGINPAGDSKKWPHTACDRFHQLVAPHEVLLLVSKGDFNKDTKSLPCDLLIEQLIRGGALEPTKIERISITAELINKGLGLPIRRKETRSVVSKSVETPEPIPTTDLSNLSETSKKSVEICNAIFPKSFTPDARLSIAPPKDCLPPPSKPTFQWKPAVPPTEQVFKGFVTNIGDDGSIHLYVVHGDTSQVDTIKKALQFKYTRSDYEYLKTPPAIGEACVAKFSIDNNWYRAEIISVYPGKVKVNFVDYGNNEIVPLSDIRLDVIMKSFPRLCQECVLFKIEDNLKWDNDLLTFLHSQLVETIVTVEVLAPPDKKGRLQCQITTLSGINIAELLLSMGFGDSADVTVTHKSPAEINQLVKTFAKSTELRAGDILPVCITQINSQNIVSLQVLKISEPKDEYEEKHNETHDTFLQLISELREKAESFPKVQEPMPGMPCCAKYSYDNDWYRCEVTDLTEDGVVVLYVDYGNSEAISSDNLRELQSNFIDFPVQIHFCELHGLKPVGSEWDPEIQKSLMETLVTNQELYAKVVVPGNISQVDLLIKTEEGDYKLAYEELIAKELVILEKTCI